MFNGITNSRPFRSKFPLHLGSIKCSSVHTSHFQNQLFSRWKCKDRLLLLLLLSIDNLRFLIADIPFEPWSQPPCCVGTKSWNNALVEVFFHSGETARRELLRSYMKKQNRKHSSWWATSLSELILLHFFFFHKWHTVVILSPGDNTYSWTCSGWSWELNISPENLINWGEGHQQHPSL